MPEDGLAQKGKENTSGDTNDQKSEYSSADAMFVSLSVLVSCIHGCVYDLTQLCKPFICSYTGNGWIYKLKR